MAARRRRDTGHHRVRRAARRWLAGTLVLATAGTGVATAGALPAAAETVYEIRGSWEEGTPGTVGSGDVVNAVWRVNVNDDQPAPANEPVDNVTFTATLVNGVFREVPNLCVTGGDANPVSSISEGGRTLTCNFGTVDQGTAVVLQTPVTVSGATGDQLTATGEIGGQQQPLDPIAIRNGFGMDMQFGSNTVHYSWNSTYTSVLVDLQWALRLAAGSDPGPDSVTYRLTMAATGAVSVGTSPFGVTGCSPFNWHTASGVPWSHGYPWAQIGPSYPADRTASFVERCTLTPVAGQPGVFDLTLSGINYDLARVPTKSSTGALLPTDWSYVASGSLWFNVATTQPGSLRLTSNAPTYRSTTGQTFTDHAFNNVTNKVHTLPGEWSGAWRRPFTGDGGNNWDDTYRVAPGTVVNSFVSHMGRRTTPTGGQFGNCLVLDTQYVTYVPYVQTTWPQFISIDGAGTWTGATNPPPLEYYTGPLGDDPAQFNCGSNPGAWSTEEPENLEDVGAVRVRHDHSYYERDGFQISVQMRIRDDVEPGQDVWMFASILRNGQWVGQGQEGTILSPTPGTRYAGTNGRRDILRIVYATPSLQKSVDRAVVRPGEPASFTLTYAANTSANLDAADDYVISDTLPVGMTYVAGSATEEPTVATNAQGQQVLTWDLDGVETNVQHTITYQAVAGDSVTPGQVLTNTATSTVGGQTSGPARAQVTVATSGSTLLAKTTDQWFIANPDGSGDGEGSWTVTLRSQDPLPQAFTDTIDILPYNGDGRGTDYEGTYAVTSVDVPAGATIYYTDADPATLSDDPNHVSNGAPNSPSAIWSTTKPANPTAIRVVGGELAPGATFAFQVNIATDGAEPGDVWVNRAQAVAEHTALVMRTSEPLTMGTMYSASLKKYVQDLEGNWRDANDPAEFPQFRVGDTVRYRIAIQNTGQGTLTNVAITDDLQPELGSFVIESLEPGATESHEFEIVLEEGGLDTVVNTASATADTPPDSEDPPTIPEDPAGFTVDGEPTHDKTLVSATPIGDGRWEVVYAIEVENTSAHPTSYSLTDELRFTDQASIVSATVTGSPDGVALAEPVWDGQGNVTVAAGVPLVGNDDDGYAPHTYELTVIADVPLQVPGAGGAEDPTQCPAEGSDAAQGFNNTSELTDETGEVERDQACAPIPSIDIDKTVSAGPVPNGDGTWTVTYDIVATNSGGADGEYEVTDRMTADGDLEVVSGAVVAAPDGVTPAESWTGLGPDQDSAENVVATDVTLPAGGSHTYQVEVVIGVAQGTDGAPVVTRCDASGGGGPGGLSNAAGVEHNDLTDTDTACVTIAFITVDKTVSDGPTPNGDGTWTVVYDVVAENVGQAAGDYDVFDRLHYGEGVDIVSADVVTTPAGVVAEGSWTGLGPDDDSAENLVAGGVGLAAGGTHTYQVRVVVEMDEAAIDPAVLACPAPGSGEPGGLANSTSLDHNGIVAIDDVCASLPLIDVAKSISAGPTPNGDGTWTIIYDLVASNTGQAAGDYDVADQLRYGAGIVVESAEVVTTPEGVAARDSWTGQGAGLDAAENLVATGVRLEQGGTHTYQVQVVVSLDQDTVTSGALDCPEPGSGNSGGLANSTQLAHNGETQADEVCATLPLIDITKSITGAVTPVEGQDGQYDVTYELEVTNRGPGDGVYDLTDTLAPGAGVTVVDATVVATPDGVTALESWTGLGPDGSPENLIVGDVDLAGNTGHVYRVTVRYSADLTDVTIPDSEQCATDDGTVAGALNNVAAVAWNGVTATDDECVRPGKPTLDKALVSAAPVGDGQWEVVYDLTVGNVGTEATTYDLDDELLFAPVITVDSVSVTGPQGVAVDETFDGAENQRIATDVAIGGLDDDGYAPHVYRVTVVASVPLHFAEGDIEADGTGSPACTSPAGGNFTAQGLNNAATLTDETGGTVMDTDCAPVPSIDIAKQLVGEPVKGSGAAWTVTYEITVKNTGAAQGAYTLTDRLRYGAGIEVSSATVTATPEGVTAAGSWTGQDDEGDAANVVAAGVTLPAGATHTYRVQVAATVDQDGADASTWACPEPGSGQAGGFANTAGIGHNDLTEIAEACATPDQPGPAAESPGTVVTPVGPLPRTGVMIGGILAAAALLLLLGSLTLQVARRRTDG